MDMKNRITALETEKCHCKKTNKETDKSNSTSDIPKELNYASVTSRSLTTTSTSYTKLNTTSIPTTTPSIQLQL